MRLLLEHEWFEPDDLHLESTTVTEPNELGKAGVKAVTAPAPHVHVHLLMQLHVNGVMIRAVETVDHGTNGHTGHTSQRTTRERPVDHDVDDVDGGTTCTTA